MPTEYIGKLGIIFGFYISYRILAHPIQYLKSVASCRMVLSFVQHSPTFSLIDFLSFDIFSIPPPVQFTKVNSSSFQKLLQTRTTAFLAKIY